MIGDFPDQNEEADLLRSFMDTLEDKSHPALNMMAGTYRMGDVIEEFFDNVEIQDINANFLKKARINSGVKRFND